VKVENIDKKENPQVLLPSIVDRIFLICKNDPNFKLKNEMEIVENRIESLKKKRDKQSDLLEQSNTIKKDLMQRIEVLEDQNSKKQIELLESLGSEL
jgi:hypothetical protein